MISPGSQGLFHRVIMESNPWALPLLTSDRALKASKKLRKALNCDDDSCLKTMDAQAIVNAGDEVQLIPNPFDVSLDVFLTWAPVVDGTVIPELLYDAWTNGNFAKLPMLMGSNTNEGIMFVNTAIKGNVNTVLYTGALALTFGLIDSFSVLKMYPPNGDNKGQLQDLLTDYIFGCAGHFFADTALAAGAGPVYMYRFDQPMSYDPWGERYAYCAENGMVCHGSELPYVFDSARLAGYSPSQADMDTTMDMTMMWASFIKTGAPGKSLTTNLNWPPYGSSTHLQGRFNAGKFSLETNYLQDKCERWDDVQYDH